MCCNTRLMPMQMATRFSGLSYIRMTSFHTLRNNPVQLIIEASTLTINVDIRQVVSRTLKIRTWKFGLMNWIP